MEPLVGGWAASMATYTFAVVAANLRLAIITTTWTWINHVFVWGSILFWFLMSFAVSSEYLVNYFSDITFTMPSVVSEPIFWLGLFWVGVIVVSFDYIYIYVRRIYYPKLKHRVQNLRRYQQQQKQQQNRASGTNQNDNNLEMKQLEQHQRVGSPASSSLQEAT